MTILYINTGTSANAGNGDSLRTAFTKINENFTYLESTLGAGGGGTGTEVTSADLGDFTITNNILSTTNSRFLSYLSLEYINLIIVIFSHKKRDLGPFF